jgi:hypothetical protein
MFKVSIGEGRGKGTKGRTDLFGGFAQSTITFFTYKW